MYRSQRYTNSKIRQILRPIKQQPIPLKEPKMNYSSANFKGNGRYTADGKYKGLPPTCGHALCHEYYCNGLALGITILVIQDKQFIFGIEADGDIHRKNKITMCMGHRNPNENCWLQTAVRELEEEFHISMSIQEFQLRTIVEFINQGVVATFVINVSGINFDEINNSVIKASENSDKDCYNEMSRLIKVPVVDLLQGNTNKIFQEPTYTIANYYSSYVSRK